MIFVFLGGVVGALSRFGISEMLTSNKIGTWLVNIIGSFLLVSLFFVYDEGTITESTFLFWGMGFSGAFTTFSTINNQLFEDLIRKEYKKALLISITTYLIILLFILVFNFLLTSLYL